VARTTDRHPTPREVVQDFIATFIEVWPTGDVSRLGSFFNDDAVYHNMPLEPVYGRAAIEDTFGEFMRMGGRVGVDVLHIVAHGPIVMTERVDHFIGDGDEMTVSLPLMGVIEVHDGAITAWRDYFDLSSFTSQMASGH
jgi:limonene-1,2-epoxide hydrolase